MGIDVTSVIDRQLMRCYVKWYEKVWMRKSYRQAGMLSEKRYAKVSKRKKAGIVRNCYNERNGNRWQSADAMIGKALCARSHHCGKNAVSVLEKESKCSAYRTGYIEKE